MKKILNYKENILFVIIIIIFLEVMINSFFKGSQTVISPIAILFALTEAIDEGILDSLMATTLRTLGGFILSALLGIILGVVIGVSKKLFKLLTPIIDFFRPLPSSAIIPLAMMLIGLNEVTNLLVIVFGGIWPILIGTISGVAEVNKHTQDSIDQLNLNRRQKLKWFILPEAAEEILTGLKISLSICLILAVTVELIGGFSEGIGKFLLVVENGANYKLMYFSIVMIAFLGYIMNRIFRFFEKRLSWVKYKYRNTN